MAEPIVINWSDGKRLVLRIALGVVLLVALSLTLATVFRAELDAIGKAFVEKLGLLGVWYGVALVDSSPVPLPHEPLLFLAISGGMSFMGILGAGALGSITAAIVGYTCGSALYKVGLVERFLGPRTYRVNDLVRRYGAWTVAFASFTPLPFGLCNWIAGALRVPLHWFLVALTARLFKMVVTVWLIHAGWAWGAP